MRLAEFILANREPILAEWEVFARSISAGANMTTLAQLLPHLDRHDPESVERTAQITASTTVMARMISDLLDYTRTRLGAGMPVKPTPMDLASLGQELFNEFRSAHPKREFRFYPDGDLKGEWDSDRLRQAISNLMGNAVQHGAEDAPVQNGGPPILPGELPHIFEPLIRGSSTGTVRKNRPGSIGMGLYIAREIAKSHGGSIDVSNEESGTAFTIRLPRHADIYTGQPILDEKHIANL